MTDSETCLFHAAKDEANKRTKERKFTCAHGKTLTWTRARWLLHLPHVSNPQKITIKLASSPNGRQE